MNNNSSHYVADVLAEGENANENVQGFHDDTNIGIPVVLHVTTFLVTTFENIKSEVKSGWNKLVSFFGG